MIRFRHKLILIFMVIPVFWLTACVTTQTKEQNDSFQDIEIKEEYGVDDSIKEQFNQAVVLLREEKYQAAIDLLLKVTEKDKKHSAPFVNLGLAYLQLGKVEESEKNFLEALKINPDHPVTNNELGIVYRRSGRFEEAMKLYQHVIQKYPLFLPARKNLGILCDLFMKDLTCAVEHYGAYLELKPDDDKVKIWFEDAKRRAER